MRLRWSVVLLILFAPAVAQSQLPATTGVRSASPQLVVTAASKTHRGTEAPGNHRDFASVSLCLGVS